jgi:uncharacterized cysteine cluster protein YcgN (CxxCxxCC family)
METIAYRSYLELKEKEYESICLMCGKCCGLLNDPCQHLQKLSANTYSCRIYDNRLGLHKTVKGNNFTCVPIKDLVKKDALPYGCAYSERGKM